MIAHNIDVAHIVQQYKSGVSVMDIARELNVSEATVYGRLNRSGVKLRTQKETYAIIAAARIKEKRVRVEPSRRMCTEHGATAPADDFPVKGPLMNVCFKCLDSWHSIKQLCCKCDRYRYWWAFTSDALTVVHSTCNICRSRYGD